MNHTLVATILVVSISACQDRNKPVYEWDLTKTQNADELTPPGKKWGGDIMALSAYGRVRIRFSAERVFDRHVEHMGFHRDGDNLTDIELALEPQIKEDLRRTAKELAEEWGANTEAIDKWEGKTGTVLMRHRDKDWSFEMVVKPGIRDDKPYWLNFSVHPNWWEDELDRPIVMPAKPVYLWDLTKTKNPDALVVPRAMPGSVWTGNTLGVLPGGRVRITFSQDRVFEHYVPYVSFKRNGPELESVSLSFEAQSKEDVKQAAKQTAEEWGANTEQIDTWDGKVGVILLRHRDKDWTIELEVAADLKPKKPYRLHLHVTKVP